jgi:hypothetical protein
VITELLEGSKLRVESVVAKGLVAVALVVDASAIEAAALVVRSTLDKVCASALEAKII